MNWKEDMLTKFLIILFGGLLMGFMAYYFITFAAAEGERIKNSISAFAVLSGL